MIKGYSLFEILYLFFCKAISFFIIPNSKIIRLPIDIRNSKAMSFGSKFTTGKYCRIEAKRKTKNKTLIIGSNVQINDFVHISAWEKVIIGNNVLIASKVYISDVSHGKINSDNYNINLTPLEQPLYCKKVEIEDNVWIGENVCILPGVHIGKNSIIGAGSVVTKDIPPYCIAVGVPAKVIKKFCFETNLWVKINV